MELYLWKMMRDGDIDPVAFAVVAVLSIVAAIFMVSREK